MKGNNAQKEQNLGGAVMAVAKWIMAKCSEGSPALFRQNHFNGKKTLEPG